MSVKTIIVKIGGKILEDPEDLNATISQFRQLLYDKEIIQKIVIIPGGGSYANFIRKLDKKLDICGSYANFISKIDKRLNIGNELAHWMGIYAMEYNGMEISKKYSDIKCIKNFGELQGLLRKKTEKLFSIFFPYDFLFEVDELPHGWDVTSDAITLYIAHKLNLKECFLIKNVDGIYIKNQNQIEICKELTIKEYKTLIQKDNLAEIQADIEPYKKSQPIDTYLLTLIEKYKMSCVILNGTKSKSRILNYFSSSEAKERVYSIIKHE